MVVVAAIEAAVGVVVVVAIVIIVVIAVIVAVVVDVVAKKKWKGIIWLACAHERERSYITEFLNYAMAKSLYLSLLVCYIYSDEHIFTTTY